MNIVYTSDDNFVPQIGTAMVSVMENNLKHPIHFYILSKNISDEHKKMLLQLTHKYKKSADIIELPPTDELCGRKIDTGGWNDIVLSRLFLDTLLPDNVERVLYLDGDTIVRQDIGEFYNTDLSDMTLAAIPEPTVPVKRKLELGLNKDSIYYNAGVLLINLKQWKTLNTGQRILDYFNMHNGRLFANDQDAINGCLSKEIIPISFRYNFCNTYYFYSYKAVNNWMNEQMRISRGEYISIIDNPSIVHFLGEERPWRYGSRHKFGYDFFKYYMKTPIGSNPVTRKSIMEYGWEKYFFLFYSFNMVMNPFPNARLRIINTLIPYFMKWRTKELQSREKHEDK